MHFAGYGLVREFLLLESSKHLYPCFFFSLVRHYLRASLFQIYYLFFISSSLFVSFNFSYSTLELLSVFPSGKFGSFLLIFSLFKTVSSHPFPPFWTPSPFPPTHPSHSLPPGLPLPSFFLLPSLLSFSPSFSYSLPLTAKVCRIKEV